MSKFEELAVSPPTTDFDEVTLLFDELLANRYAPAGEGPGAV